MGGDKSPFPIPKTQSPFRQHARQSVARRRDVRQPRRSVARWNPQLDTAPAPTALVR